MQDRFKKISKKSTDSPESKNSVVLQKQVVKSSWYIEVPTIKQILNNARYTLHSLFKVFILTLPITLIGRTILTYEFISDLDIRGQINRVYSLQSDSIFSRLVQSNDLILKLEFLSLIIKSFCYLMFLVGVFKWYRKELKENS